MNDKTHTLLLAALESQQIPPSTVELLALAKHALVMTGLSEGYVSIAEAIDTITRVEEYEREREEREERRIAEKVERLRKVA